MPTDHAVQSKSTLLSSLPPAYPSPSPKQTLRQITKSRLGAPDSRIPLLVILDDDPTGTQTCHDIPVLCVWDRDTLSSTFQSTRAAGAGGPGGFFILTNSRALHPPEARSLVREICTNLVAAADVEFEVVLRSDSTLRGHFPLEPRAVEDVLGPRDAWILAPFFLQGGRYTVDDVHYVAEGEDDLVPAARTQFARDATFGYTASDLREWVVEKSRGDIEPSRIKSLGLLDIRTGGPERVGELLMGWEKGSVVVVNAAAEEDMDVVVLGLLEGEYDIYIFPPASLFFPQRSRDGWLFENIITPTPDV